jgi:Ca2+-binding EF-hand superfamily protein
MDETLNQVSMFAVGKKWEEYVADVNSPLLTKAAITIAATDERVAFTAVAMLLGLLFLCGCFCCCSSRSKPAGPNGDSKQKTGGNSEPRTRSLTKQTSTVTSSKDVICLMAEAKAVFAEIDADNSGDIDSKELEEKLIADEKARKILKLNIEEIPRFMEEADTDKNGTLNLGEFLAALKKRNLFGNLQPSTKTDFVDLARDVFNQIDIDNNGSLDFEELKSAYIMMASAKGQKPSTQTVKNWAKNKIKGYDNTDQGEGKGTIEFEEFVKLFENNGELALLAAS